MTIGVGIITCDRRELFERCISSIPKADVCVVVNDGEPLDLDLSNHSIDFLVQHEHRYGVAKSKNDALELLVQEGCDHIFLVEDDIKVKQGDIFDFYIKASESTGIEHFNFCLSSQKNINRYSIRYNNGVGISFYRNLYQPWAYFSRRVIERVGFYDTAFYNALEHVDHTYRIIQAGFHPPYWWFADPTESKYYLETLDVGFKQSVVRKDYTAFRKNMVTGVAHFVHKHGIHPAKVVDASREEVKESLRHLFMHAKESTLTSESN